MKEKMKGLKRFYPQFKLHKVCGKGGSRPVYEYIYFKNGNAYATNAYVAIAAPLSFVSNFEPKEKTLLEGKFIHSFQFAKLLKMKNISVKPFGEELVFDCRTKEGETVIIPLIAENKIGTYPNIEKEMEEAEGSIKEDYNPLPFFGFNFKFFKGLQEAMNAERFEFYFSKTNREIIVRDADISNEIRAILMPVLVDDPRF